ncbi:DUF4443 domain-containing protein [Candidatus Woesearchaeota archaeon]|nr:DUF4443 domain-containing protein [Candidatus Woesearchaeota archaeon]
MVGNIPNFTKIDILRCFLRFQKNTGRQEIAKDLELGEGTVRTVLEILKSKKLLDSTKKGHFLSKRGEEILNQIYEILSTPRNVAMRHLYPDFKKIGVIVRNASNLKELYKLRDIAVKNGADGALILKFENRLYAPESDYEQDYKELEKSFDFRNGDVLIVAFANDKRNAENGALAIAVELSNFLKRFISEF